VEEENENAFLTSAALRLDIPPEGGRENTENPDAFYRNDRMAETRSSG
jgi:hypothetical protein